MTVLRHTWYMVVRQARNLMREPIWIVLLLVQPMVWLVLYGQLFKNVTHLGGFGTTSYVTFLAPAIVVMNSFFGATWSGMGMIYDLDHKFVERVLATPASRFAIVLSQIVRSALTAAIQAVIILVVALALGVRVHSGAAGWLIVILAAILVNSAFAGISQGIALLTRREATMIALANFIGLPLLFVSTTLLARGADAALDAGRRARQPDGLGRPCRPRGGAPGNVLEHGRPLPRVPARPLGRDRVVGDLVLPRLRAHAVGNTPGTRVGKGGTACRSRPSRTPRSRPAGSRAWRQRPTRTAPTATRTAPTATDGDGTDGTDGDAGGGSDTDGTDSDADAEDAA